VTFADVRAGASLFIDANTFIYHFSPHLNLGLPCTELLERIHRGELSGITSIDVLRDVAHRMMTAEAIARQGWPVAGIAQRLRKRPDVIQSLTVFRHAVDEVPRFGIKVLQSPVSIASAAAAVSQQHGLLSGDAMIVALMQQFGLTNLASHDDDFDRVPWLTRYAPV
jgi:predicted nucleic acid-binding protein